MNRLGWVGLLLAFALAGCASAPRVNFAREARDLQIANELRSVPLPEREAKVRAVIAERGESYELLLALGEAIPFTDIDARRPVWERAIELRPDRVEAYLERGNDLRVQAKLWPESDQERLGALELQQYVLAQAADPTSPRSFFAAGEWHSQRYHYEQAEAGYRRALELDPSHYAARIRWAELARRFRRTELARSLIQKEVESHPQRAEAWVELGWQRFSFDEDFRGARDAFRQGTLADPLYVPAEAHYGVGLSENLLGNHEAALRAFRQANQPALVFSGPRDVMFQIGFQLEKLRRFAEARQACETYLRSLPPGDFFARSPQLRLLRIADRVVRAQEALRRQAVGRALRLLKAEVRDRPVNGYAWRELGQVYVRQKKGELAKEAFLRAAEAVGYEDDVAMASADALRNLQFYPEAITVLERANARHWGFDIGHVRRLVEIRLQIGDPEGAQNTIESYLARLKDNTDRMKALRILRQEVQRAPASAPHP